MSSNVKAIYQYVLGRAARSGGRILDYGCGRGEVVQAGLSQGLDIVGADVFYAGNDARQVATAKGILGTHLVEMIDGRLPFPDGHFQCVVSTQVLEHVADLETALSEISRVLAPGGRFIALFPTTETWREGHCEIPFAHRFRRGSRLRDAYLMVMRCFGLGAEKAGRSRREFVRMWADYLDRFTVYRTRREIEAAFSRHFSHIRGSEAGYVAYRLRMRGNRRLARAAEARIISSVAAWACVRFAGVVLDAER